MTKLLTAIGVTDVHRVDGLGTPITLVQLNPLEGEISSESADPHRVAESIVDGRAQVSLGAWAEFDVEGVGLGGMAQRNQDIEQVGLSVNVKVHALPEVDVRWVYLFVNCDLTHTWEVADPHASIKLDAHHMLQLSEDAWVIVMAFGEEAMPIGLKNYDPRVIPRLVTNAIYIDADADEVWSPPGGKHCAVPEGRW